MKIYQSVFLVCAGGLMGACQNHGMEWVATTYEHPWQVRQPVTAGDKVCDSTVVVDPSQTAQTFNGWGTCFSEQSWKALSYLKQEQRDSIMRELFARSGGLSLTMARTPIGASDFALSYYSYDDADGDFGMERFSIDRDSKMLLPLIREALKVNPELRLWASPWCPPAWMKYNKHYACNSTARIRKMIMARMASLPDSVRHRMGGNSGISGWLSVDNGLPENKSIDEGQDAFIQEPAFLAAYAKYFGLYVDAYKRAGVNISMVMPQNEFNSAQPYPSCVWKAQSLANFIGQYLGPEMEKRGVQVYYGTIERASVPLSETVLRDHDAARYIKGMGFQWAGKGALPQLHREFPQLPCIMSEQECGDGKNDWKNVEHSWGLMKHYLKHGVSGWFYWNTALRENVPSVWGWHQNSLITVNDTTRTYKYTPEFYLLKHASHYVLPGARYVRLGGTFQNAIAFVNTDGSVVVLAANLSDTQTQITVQLSGRNYTVALQPHSVNTLKVEP